MKLTSVATSTCPVAAETRPLKPTWTAPAAPAAKREQQERQRDRSPVRPAAPRPDPDGDDRQQRRDHAPRRDRHASPRTEPEPVDHQARSRLTRDSGNGEERDAKHRHGRALSRDVDGASDSSRQCPPRQLVATRPSQEWTGTQPESRTSRRR